jgi:glycosyltransferase involved in cell wall biosynthesis
MSKELVSIIVPCYNHAQFIIETLSSVLQSSYTNIEIIIVNDGSTDNSEEIALEFCQIHPNILYLNQKNSGPASARNHGIHNAKGKYILPLDADDIISIDYIEKAVHVF